MEKLEERIGIDKTVICEIAIKAIDKEKLRKKSLQDGIYINFIENEKSPIVTKNGICISELEIKDDSIGRLLIKHTFKCMLLYAYYDGFNSTKSP